MIINNFKLENVLCLQAKTEKFDVPTQISLLSNIKFVEADQRSDFIHIANKNTISTKTVDFLLVQNIIFHSQFGKCI